MKKQIILIVALFLMAGINAGAAVIDSIYYNLTHVYEAEVARDSTNTFSYSGDIVIPDTVYYKGVAYRVVTVGNSAFAGCEKLNSVTLPSSV